MLIPGNILCCGLSRSQAHAVMRTTAEKAMPPAAWLSPAAPSCPARRVKLFAARTATRSRAARSEVPKTPTHRTSIVTEWHRARRALYGQSEEAACRLAGSPKGDRSPGATLNGKPALCGSAQTLAPQSVTLPLTLFVQQVPGMFDRRLVRLLRQRCLAWRVVPGCRRRTRTPRGTFYITQGQEIHHV